MSAQNSGTIGVLTIDVISKPIRTNVDAIRLQGYFGKMSIGGDTRMSETSEDAHEESPSRQSRFKRTVAWEYLRPIVVAVALVFGFMRPFVVEPFQIPSGSMEDTLLAGDRILVCKFIYGVGIPETDIKLFDVHEPARGDVFVFVPLHEKSQHFIKRIVAVGGDTVETKRGALYVNDVAVKDDAYTKRMPRRFRSRYDFPPFRARLTFCLITTLSADYKLSPEQFHAKFPDEVPFKVSEGHVFAMGDNRDQSSDSRTWGTVPVSQIKGGAFMVFWSYDLLNPKKPWQIWKMIDDHPI